MKGVVSGSVADIQGKIKPNDQVIEVCKSVNCKFLNIVVMKLQTIFSLIFHKYTCKFVPHYVHGSDIHTCEIFFNAKKLNKSLFHDTFY